MVITVGQGHVIPLQILGHNVHFKFGTVQHDPFISQTSCNTLKMLVVQDRYGCYRSEVSHSLLGDLQCHFTHCKLFEMQFLVQLCIVQHLITPDAEFVGDS